MQARLTRNQSPVNLIVLFLAIAAALVIGATAGYVLKPQSPSAAAPVLISTADQPNPSSQPCAFRAGTKGC